MTKIKGLHRGMLLIVASLMMATCIYWPVPVHAAADTDTVNKESIVTNVKNPSNGVIKYDVKVPAGERIDYSVELTPDKANGNADKVVGSWKNKARKTVTKTITVRVKYLSNKYKIKASYSKETIDEKIVYKDVESATSKLKTSIVTAKLKWDFSKLGQGNKEWKYRYKYAPYKDGFRKYLQVFDKYGKQIKNYVKQYIPVSKTTKLMN